MLYTKILVSLISDSDRLFELSTILCKGFFEKEAKIVAEKIATLIKKEVPEYLLGEWQFANSIANMPVLDVIVEALIEKGILTPPDNGIGAEGCWMSIAK